MLEIAQNYAALDIAQLLEVYCGSMTTPEKEEDFLSYLRYDFFRKNAAYYLWKEKDRYVSVLRLEPYLDGFLLSGLETAPQDRRRGYGRQLLQSVLQMLNNEEDCIIYSHIFRNNIPSMKLHLQCGFVKRFDYAKLLDGTVSANADTLIYVVKNNRTE